MVDYRLAPGGEAREGPAAIEAIRLGIAPFGHGTDVRHVACVGRRLLTADANGVYAWSIPAGVLQASWTATVSGVQGFSFKDWFIEVHHDDDDESVFLDLDGLTLVERDGAELSKPPNRWKRAATCGGLEFTARRNEIQVLDGQGRPIPARDWTAHEGFSPQGLIVMRNEGLWEVRWPTAAPMSSDKWVALPIAGKRYDGPVVASSTAPKAYTLVVRQAEGVRPNREHGGFDVPCRLTAKAASGKQIWTQALDAACETVATSTHFVAVSTERGELIVFGASDGEVLDVINPLDDTHAVTLAISPGERFLALTGMVGTAIVRLPATDPRTNGED